MVFTNYNLRNSAFDCKVNVSNTHTNTNVKFYARKLFSLANRPYTERATEQV